MKLRLIFALFLFFSSFLSSQESRMYPLKKDSSWWFFSQAQHLKLENYYDFINYFDNHGYAYYSRNNHYGFIDQNGVEQVQPIYSKVEHLTGDFYLVDSFGQHFLYAAHNQLKLSYNWCKKLDNHWVYFKKDRNLFVFNDQWKIPRKLHAKAVLFQFNSYVGIAEHTEKIIFSPKGILIDSALNALIATKEYLYFQGRQSHQLLVKNKVNQLPLKVDFSDFINGKFYYSINHQLTLLDYRTGKIEFTAKGERLSLFYTGYKIYEDALIGILSLKGIPLAKTIYSSINKAPTHAYYIVQKQSYFGVLDVDFKERLQAIYSSITPIGDFLVARFLTVDRVSLGLVSLKSYAFVLPCVYDELIPSDTLVRTWLNGQLAFIYLNKNHTVKETIYFDKALSINQRQKKIRPVNYDRRLLSLGWFLDTSYRNSTTVKGTVVNAWGFKRNDSVKIKPVFKSLKYLENTSMTLLPLNPVFNESSIANPFFQKTLKVRSSFLNLFHVFNHSTLKKLQNVTIFSVFEQDFMIRNFARVLTQYGFGLLFSNGTIQQVDYYKEQPNSTVQYAVGGVLNEISHSTQFSNYYRALVLSYAPFSRERIDLQQSYELVNSKWNCLTKNGNKILKNDVDGLEEFTLRTAIFRDQQNYGIINEDSVIVAPIYHSLQRISELGDTLFLAGRKTTQKVYYDSKFRPLPLTGYVIKSVGVKNRLFESEKNNLVLDENNQLLGTTNALHFHKFDYLVEKKNKDYVILDARLNPIGTVKTKPIEFLTTTTFITQNNQKYGVLSLDNDTILPFNFRKISSLGKLIVSESSDEIHIYDNAFKLLFKMNAEGTVLYDQISGNIALQDERKVRVYSAEFKLLAKWKTIKELTVFHGGLLLSSNASVIYSQKGALIAEEQNNKTIELNGAYVHVVQTNGQVTVYDFYGKVCLDEKETHKSIVYHGKNNFSFYDKEKREWVLCNLDTKKEKRSDGKFTGNFDNDSLIVFKHQQVYYFLNDSLELAFNSSYDFATPFKSATAIVQTAKGFSILDKNGKYLALPNKGRLHYVTKNLIEEVKLPNFTIINSRGVSQLPAGYASIHVLDNGVIQAINGEEIHYIDLNGQSLFTTSKKEVIVEK